MIALLYSAQGPIIDQLPIFDRLGIVAIVVGVCLLFGYMLFRGHIMLGSTCNTLLAIKAKEAEHAKAEAIAAREDVTRIADDFNANMALVIKHLAPGERDVV